MNYKPHPIDTSNIDLDPVLFELRERLAENAHEVWALSRIQQGWCFGASRDDTQKRHPCLIPYNELSEDEKQIDRIMVEQALKTIIVLGFRIEPPPIKMELFDG